MKNPCFLDLRNWKYHFCRPGNEEVLIFGPQKLKISLLRTRKWRIPYFWTSKMENLTSAGPKMKNPWFMDHKKWNPHFPGPGNEGSLTFGPQNVEIPPKWCKKCYPYPPFVAPKGGRGNTFAGLCPLFGCLHGCFNIPGPESRQKVLPLPRFWVQIQ